MRKNRDINNTYSILLLVCEGLYITYFVTALAVLTVSLRRLNSLLHKHSGSGTNRQIAILHGVMIALLFVARLFSDSIEAIIWLDSIGVNVIESQDLIDDYYALKGIVYDIAGTGATLILIYMLWRFTLMQMRGKTEAAERAKRPVSAPL